MPTFTVSRDIAAPAAVAWARLSDVRAWPDWLPTVKAVEPVSGAGLTPGAAFKVVQPRLRPQVWTVTALEPGRRFTWESRSPGLSLWATHVVRPKGGGGCEVELAFRFSGPLGALLGFLFGPITRRYIATEAESLRRLAESGGARGV